MKKALLIGLPLAVLFLVGGYVFSQTEPGDRDSIHRHILENYSRAGYRLGVVLSEEGSDQGVTIERVEPDSPADRAGIQEGDVITHLDGEKVISPSDVRDFLRNLKEPKELNIEVLRDGRPVTLNVTPEKREGFMRGFRAFGGRQIGVNVQSLDPDLASYFKVEPNSGLLISKVDREGPAAEAGVRSGDILTHIDGNRVSDPEDVRRMIGEGEAETVELTVLRHGNEMKMTVKPIEREMFGGENFPNLRELPRMMESPEFKSEMDNLRNEMDQLKHELQGLRKEELDALKDEIRQQLQQEMDKIRRELKEEKNKS